jgi:hypothetical protein
LVEPRPHHPEKHEKVSDKPETNAPTWMNYYNWKLWQDESGSSYKDPTKEGFKDWKQWNDAKSAKYPDWNQYVKSQKIESEKEATPDKDWSNWKGYMSEGPSGDPSQNGFDWSSYAGGAGGAGGGGAGGAGGGDWEKWTKGGGSEGGADWNKWANGDWNKYTNGAGGSGGAPESASAEEAYAETSAEGISDLSKDEQLQADYQDYGSWRDWLKAHKQEAPQGDSFESWQLWKQETDVEDTTPSWAHFQAYKNYLEWREMHGSTVEANSMEATEEAAEEAAKKHHKHHHKHVATPTPPTPTPAGQPPKPEGQDWEKYVPENYRNFTGAGGPGGPGGWKSFIPGDYQKNVPVFTGENATQPQTQTQPQGATGETKKERKDLKKYPWAQYVPADYRDQAIKDAKKKDKHDHKHPHVVVVKKDKHDHKKHDHSHGKKHPHVVEAVEAVEIPDSTEYTESSEAEIPEESIPEPSATQEVEVGQEAAAITPTAVTGTGGLQLFFALVVCCAIAMGSVYYCFNTRKRQEYHDIDRLLV